MKKRHGFLMLWLLIGVMAVTVMGVAVFLIFYQMVIYEEERETETDEIFLVQEALEREKYNLAFHKSEPALSGNTERNGRTYDVVLEREALTVEGVPVMKVTCRAGTGGKKSFTASFIWGERS